MVSFRNFILSPLFLNAVWLDSTAAVDISSILTEAVFNLIAPNADLPYTYSGFISAVNDWNSGHSSNQIFLGSTEMEQRHELAAFFGNTLHESDAFRAPREYFMCENNIDVASDVYCQLPSTQFQYAYQQYCSTEHTNPATGYEDGCNCALEGPDATQGGTYVLADKLYFGRGAIQLSWNYNYIDASKELTGSASTLCDNPELVATNPTYAWGTAFWFWTMNTGSVGKTCSAAVMTDGDFGGTVNTINGMECPLPGNHNASLAQRLNYYCKAATSLSIDALLAMDDCSVMQPLFDSCAVSGGLCPDCEVWAQTNSPSSSPTKSPVTSSPTLSPVTAQPSKSPTRSPTKSPVSSSPTLPPMTSQPSKSPTSSPTLSPMTSQPSKSPTSSPSLSPTTLHPTKMPTTSPTKSPVTTSPSLSPATASPTAAVTPKPTKSPVSSAPTKSGSGEYFPNWGAGSAGPHVCLLDDGRSSVPSGASLFLSLQECCDTHYGWNFNECMGIVIRSSGKYFPNWNASPNICLLDDGSHTLPAGAPLFADLATCCSSHYSWNLNECNGVVLGPTDKYFPNWEGTDPVCHLDDGSNIVPGYAPLYNDLATCCARHYSWNSNECNGVVAVPTNKYFPNWEGVPHVCLLDDGSNSLPVGAPLFADLATCCATHYSWNSNECNGVNAPSNKYFPNWGGAPHVCLLDDGSISLPSGALKYDTLSLCCATHYSWNSNECNGSLAPPSGMFFPDWEGTNDGCLKDDGSNDVPSYIQSNPSTFMHSSGQECCQIRYSWRYNACLANLR